MAPTPMSRPNALRISALALATLSLTPMPAPSAAQTIYRQYEDGGLESWTDEEIRDRSAAPLRRPPPRAFDDDDDDRFEREDDDDDLDEDEDDIDRQGTLDLAPDRPDINRQRDFDQPDGSDRPLNRPGVDRSALDRKAPAPPPSVNAKPAANAWKPAL